MRTPFLPLCRSRRVPLRRAPLARALAGFGTAIGSLAMPMLLGATLYGIESGWRAICLWLEIAPDAALPGQAARALPSSIR